MFESFNELGDRPSLVTAIGNNLVSLSHPLTLQSSVVVGCVCEMLVVVSAPTTVLAPVTVLATIYGGLTTSAASADIPIKGFVEHYHHSLTSL